MVANAQAREFGVGCGKERMVDPEGGPNVAVDLYYGLGVGGDGQRRRRRRTGRHASDARRGMDGSGMRVPPISIGRLT
jgi:hypothetical protein